MCVCVCGCHRSVCLFASKTALYSGVSCCCCCGRTDRPSCALHNERRCVLDSCGITCSFLTQFETSGEGEALQRSLLEYAADKDSFVEEFWDDSYLTPKSSVVLNLK